MSNTFASAVAQSIPFDNTSTTLTSTNVQEAIVEVSALSGGGGAATIPELETDPAPVIGQSWVLASGRGSPMGLLLAITSSVNNKYEFSFRTASNRIVRMSLT